MEIFFWISIEILYLFYVKKLSTSIDSTDAKHGAIKLSTLIVDRLY